MPLARAANGKLGVVAANGGGGGTVIHFAPVTTIDARGSTITEAQIKALVDQRDRTLRSQLPDIIHKSVRDPRSR